MKKKAGSGKPRSKATSREKTPAKSTICWAVDPFHDDPSFHTHALNILLPFARDLEAKIVPVSFVDPFRALEGGSHRFPILPLNSEPLKSLKASAETRLEKITSKTKNEFVETPVLLTEAGTGVPTLRGKVGAICKEAKRRNALFVAIHSHSWRGAKRLYMGSFAETFLLASSVPTLIVNPKCSPSKGIRHILFPTDFSEESLVVFDSVVKIAAKLGARISVVHFMQGSELAMFLQAAALKQYESELNHQQSALARKGKKLISTGQKSGVPTTFELLVRHEIFDTTSVILEFAARKKVDLISLAATSGVVKSILLGALSRSLAREAQCPVLICRQSP